MTPAKLNQLYLFLGEYLVHVNRGHIQDPKGHSAKRLYMILKIQDDVKNELEGKGNNPEGNVMTVEL